MRRRHFLTLGAASMAATGLGRSLLSPRAEGLVFAGVAPVEGLPARALAETLLGFDRGLDLDAIAPAAARPGGASAARTRLRALGFFGADPSLQSAAVDVCYDPAGHRRFRIARHLRIDGVDPGSGPVQCVVPTGRTEGLQLEVVAQRGDRSDRARLVLQADASLAVLAFPENRRAPRWEHLRLVPASDPAGPLLRRDGQPAGFPYLLLHLDPEADGVAA